ncbi:hypothetical protein MASR1M32_10340 [Rhodobacter sp.]
MVSFLQRLALPFLSAAAPAMAMQPGLPMFAPRQVSTGGNHHGWTRSKHTVAQDRRAAAKTRARKRAKKLGQA